MLIQNSETMSAQQAAESFIETMFPGRRAGTWWNLEAPLFTIKGSETVFMMTREGECWRVDLACGD